VSHIDQAESAVLTIQSISLSSAQRVVNAALVHAEELDCRVSVVVLDAGGNVSALARRDGTAATVTTVALNKANTALTMRVATDAFAKAIQTDLVLLTSLANQPGIALLAGGLPLTREDAVIGAIGVSGALDGKDLLIARAGAEALDS
jgi:uncharacterized protein GlcG (DUF336 family)